jgi:hypothetical protein
VPVHGRGFENRRNVFYGEFQSGDLTTETGVQLLQEDGGLILIEQAVQGTP